jgi:hypothetical protein
MFAVNSVLLTKVVEFYGDAAGVDRAGYIHFAFAPFLKPLPVTLNVQIESALFSCRRSAAMTWTCPGRSRLGFGDQTTTIRGLRGAGRRLRFVSGLLGGSLILLFQRSPGTPAGFGEIRDFGVYTDASFSFPRAFENLSWSPSSRSGWGPRLPRATDAALPPDVRKGLPFRGVTFH